MKAEIAHRMHSLHRPHQHQLILFRPKILALIGFASVSFDVIDQRRATRWSIIHKVPACPATLLSPPVLNGRLEFKRPFETNASREKGVFVDFYGLKLFGYGGGSVAF
jgi:hypothetical protein